MIELIDNLRSSTDFNILNTMQNGAIWSAKDGNYFYLLNTDDNTKLKVVDTIDTYLLSNEIVVPRDLRRLDGNAQYMKSINFHIAFEAIQVSNVSSVLSETKQVFNLTFPESEDEKMQIKVTFKGFDLISDLKVENVQDGEVLLEPEVEIPLNVNNEPMYVLEGWYSDSSYNEKFEFGIAIEGNVTLYPLVYEVSDGLKFTEIKSNNEIVAYSVGKGTCDDVFVVVPDTYKGKPVTKVDSSAFNNMTILEDIYLPNTITNIGDSAFNGCTKLKITKLPNDLQSVGMSTFNNCVSLALTSLPDGLTSIGMSAFHKCESMVLTSLPNALTRINTSAFNYCTNLALTSLPSGLTNIGAYAFNECKSLSLTELPSTLTNIGNYAFSGCTNLALKSIPNGITVLYDYVFKGCTNLALSAIPNSVKTIGWNVFTGCTNLTSIVLPSSLTSIGNYAFSDCFNLNYILCQTSEVASLVQCKGREDKYIYALQEIGYDSALSESEVVIYDSLTIYTATDSDGYKWVRTSENQYYKCIVI